MKPRDADTSDWRKTAPAGFDLADYAARAEQREAPTVVIPSVLLLTLLAEATRDDEAQGSRIELTELDPDDFILIDDDVHAASNDDELEHENASGALSAQRT